MNRILKVFIEGDAPFALKGEVEIRENKGINGLFALSVPLMLVVPFITIPIIPAIIPTNGVDPNVCASVSMVDTQNNEILLKKEYEHSFKKKFTDYTSNPAKPTSKLNNQLTTLIDKLYREIAVDISNISNNTTSTASKEDISDADTDSDSENI